MQQISLPIEIAKLSSFLGLDSFDVTLDHVLILKMYFKIPFYIICLINFRFRKM